MGIRQDVNVTTRVTYQLDGVDPTPYPYYSPPTKSYEIKPHLFTVPDNGIVPIQIDIPSNATSISLTVRTKTLFRNDPSREKTNTLESALCIDPDQPKHAAQAYPD